jgi:glycosyltransferase involved in cell wall biosynthesis
MLSGRDIVYISTIEWSFIWQQNQEIALRLARAGNRVLYVENTGARSPRIGDATRIISRLRRWATSLASHGVREVAPNVFVCSPLILPPFGSRIQQALNRRLLLPIIRRAARRLGMRNFLLWTYLPTDTAVGLIKLMRTPTSPIVYYCLTDFPQLSSDPEKMRESEASLLRMSDVVFTSCAQLAERLAPMTNKVQIFPMGVDLSVFDNVAEKAAGDDLPLYGTNEKGQSLRRPIIGYVGGLHKHVDFDLLASMAAARPEWSWVFVGPFQERVEMLQQFPNIHLMGPKPHPDLARYLRSFDVCIVPYVKSAYTETVVPVKLNEYLAAGKAVVSTSLPTVCEFNERHHVLTIAGNERDEFLAGIETALSLPNDEATVKRRRQVAALADWNVIVETMSELIERSEAEESVRPGN